MEIKKENIIAAYKNGTESEKTLLATLFPELLSGHQGKQADDRPITERIKTFDDAVNELGVDHLFVQDWKEYNGRYYDVEAHLKLRIICAALNEGWQPKFTEGERRYYPWFCLYTKTEFENMSEEEKKKTGIIDTGDYDTEYAGLAYALSDNCASSNSTAFFGSHLCLKTRDLSVYCGKQFISLWADFCLIRK